MRSGGLSFSTLQAGEGIPVFLLHGFPDTSQTWEGQIPPLVEAGYRVLAPTCRGYEPSSQPADNDYSLTTMGHDVLNWMDHLDIDKAHVVGHDWGSFIAQTAAKLAPDRFHSLTMMAAPPLVSFNQLSKKNFAQARKSWYVLFFQVPYISEHWVQKNNFEALEKLWASWSPGFVPAKHAIAELKSTFSKPGVVKAALSYYRQAVKSANLEQLTELFDKPFAMPALAVTGKQDGCIGPDMFISSVLARDFGAEYRVSEIDRAGHFLNQERPTEISALLLDWLRGHDPH